MYESFLGTLECELLDRNRLRSQAEARTAVFGYLEDFYNPRRRHSALARRLCLRVFARFVIKPREQ
jgi:putative transposase